VVRPNSAFAQSMEIGISRIAQPLSHYLVDIVNSIVKGLKNSTQGDKDKLSESLYLTN
jgi:hypothetical protein